jgi:hypothetical protein
MTPRTKTVAQQTNRPALYGRVYWGQFPAGHDNAISPEIIANRNRLASDYRLKSLAGCQYNYPPRESPDDFDHGELYRTKDGGLVLICSNYGGPPPAPMGMKEIYPVYSTGATTYLRTFQNLSEIHRAVAACWGLGSCATSTKLPATTKLTTKTDSRT